MLTRRFRSSLFLKGLRTSSFF